MSRVEPRKRRRLFWYQDFQPSFVWGFGGAVLAALMAGAFSLLILFMVQGRAVVPDVFPLLIAFDLIILLALLLIIYWVILFVSHRMGGPLYRISLLCEQLGKGHLDQRVSLRRGDQLQEVAQAFNQGLGGLRHRIRQVRGQVALLCQMEQEGEIKAQAQRLSRELDELFII